MGFLLLIFLGCCVFCAIRRSFSERPTPSLCKNCHKAIFQQWEQSPHSHANSSPELMALTDNGKLTECMVCHVTNTVWTGVEPLTTYPAGQGKGIDCASCHWEDGKIVAATFSTKANRIHRLVIRDSIKNDIFMCGQCHEKPYLELKAFENLSANVTCQECHLERPAQKTREEKKGIDRLLSNIHSIEADHSLRLETLAFFPGALTASLERCELTTSTIEVVVQITNYVPHSIPSVDFGENKVFARVELPVSDGSRLDMVNVIDSANPIKPLAEHRFKYSFTRPSSDVHTVIFQLLHQRKEQAQKILMFRESFAVKGIMNK